VQIFVNVEPVKQNCRVGFGGVAVFVADYTFKLAQAHAVLVGHLGFLVNTVALFKRRHKGLLPMMAVSITR